MNPSTKTTIILVDDHQMLRDGLRNLIEQKANLQILGEASNGREAIKLCAKLNPDVVITDVSMPNLNGIESAKQILKGNPEIK
ncbi:MAG: response regulator, partial [Flavobacteriales bacterium]